MKAYLIQVDARDSAGSPLTMRFASHDDAALCHHDGHQWRPAIAELPTLSYDFFDGGFQGDIVNPSGSFSLSMDAYPDMASAIWTDAAITVHQLDLGDFQFPKPVLLGEKIVTLGGFRPVLANAQIENLSKLFEGRIRAQPSFSNGRASVDFESDDRWLDEPLLDTYAGTGDVEGPDELEGSVKPLLLGAPRFVPGVLVDAVDIVYQLSAYGPVQQVEAVFDRLSSLGSSTGDYSSFSALVSATIASGSWATCNALGLVRLGAPPDGQVSFHARGDNAAGWARLPGDIISRIAGLANGSVSPTSLTELNSERPYSISLAITEQITARELIQSISASIKAVAGVDWFGKLFVAPVGITSATRTLKSDGTALPAIAEVSQLPVDPPFWRLATESEKTWVVHSDSDIAYQYNFRGAYAAARVYRLDDVVSTEDGSTWRFIGANPLAGSTPSDANANWERRSDATVVDFADVTGSTKPEANATRNQARGNYASGTQYSVGDSVVWTVASGGTGHNYTRIGSGDTTGTAPSDGTKWALTVERGEPGVDGSDGAQGPQGPQGVAGSDGADGTPRYNWIAYADSADGSTNFTNGAPGSRKYIGIASNKTSSTESSNAADYVWSKFVGDDGATGPQGPQGDQGIQGPAGTQGDTGATGAAGAQGPAGADGQTLYTWIAYANNITGTSGFTTGTNTGQTHIGIANNKSTATEGTNPADYTWSLIKGDQGVAGSDGADGSPTYTWFAYADSADGSNNFTTGAPGTRKYLGLAANKSTATEGTNPADYTWSKIEGPQGIQGPQGDQGIQGPAGTQGDTGATGAAGAQGPAGTDGQDGADGADGQTLYTWIAYANNITGTSGFTTGTNTGQTHIGIANNKTSATEGTNPADYTWSLIKGDQGVAGTPGADGAPTYTWFAYADSADGSTNFTTGAPGTRKYLGIAANKSTATEGTTPSDYTWSKIEGPQGIQGIDGPGGPQGVQGIPGTDGTDGIDGTDGKVVEFVWKRAATQPSTPSGNGIPTGWTDEPPSGSDPLWMSSVKQELDGTLVSGASWSTPIQHNGPKGDTGNTGATGATGAQGPQGIQGPNGADGTPRYIWIAYADNATGSINFTNGAPGSRKYIGIASNKTSSTESTNAADYNWSLITGADGQDGSDGATGPQGPQGVAGVDGVDGTDGKLTEFVFQRSISQPATPTGNGIPAGWFDDIPAGDMPLWMSRSKQELDGTLVTGTGWDAPIRWAEDDQLLIVADLTAANALNPKVGQRAMVPDGTIYQRVSSTGILLDGKVITLSGFRPSIKWTATADQPIVEARKVARIDGIWNSIGDNTIDENELLNSQQKNSEIQDDDGKKPEDNADVTANAVPLLEAPVNSITIECDYTGTPLTGELPRAVKFTRKKGSTDVSASTTWTLPSSGGITSTISSNGILNITAMAATESYVIVRAVADSVTMEKVLEVKKNLADPPEASGTSVTTGVMSAFSGTAFTDISGEFDIDTGATGELSASFSATITPAAGSPSGSWNIEMKFQYSTDGGTNWSDFASAVSSNPDPTVTYESEPPGFYIIGPYGSINLMQTKTGLTASTTHKARLIAKVSATGKVMSTGNSKAQLTGL